MSIFIAGDPSPLAAVAMLPAFCLTPSTESSASADWIFKYGSMIDRGISAPAAGVFPV
jgi:hypothetical protein